MVKQTNSIKEMTGEFFVYPGHPLVLATTIMQLYPDFAHADQPTKHGWCVVMSDIRVSGAGDHVGAAMRTLKMGTLGHSIDAMVAYTHRYWNEGNAGGHTKNVAAGNAQAQMIEPHFRRIAQEWFKVAVSA